MKTLTFCPDCGKQKLTFVDEKKWHCTECHFSLYHNIATAVAVIIRWENEIFFTRRNQAPKLGLLDLAGGFTDANETAEETCIRELKEELGILFPIEKLKYLGSQPNIYPYNGIIYRTLDLFYELCIEEKFSPTLAKDEISEGIWINISELNLEEIAFESQKTFLEKKYKK